MFIVACLDHWADSNRPPTPARKQAQFWSTLHRPANAIRGFTDTAWRLRQEIIGHQVRRSSKVKGITMPALPWTTRRDIEPDRTYVAMASRLPLQRYRSTLRFLRYTLAIRRQLAVANGLVGYSLYAQLTRKTFWTFSAWDDGDSLDAFATSDPHRQITHRLADRMGPTKFESLSVSGADLPLDWDELAQRLG